MHISTNTRGIFRVPRPRARPKKIKINLVRLPPAKKRARIPTKGTRRSEVASLPRAHLHRTDERKQSLSSERDPDASASSRSLHAVTTKNRAPTPKSAGCISVRFTSQIRQGQMRRVRTKTSRPPLNFSHETYDSLAKETDALVVLM